MLRVPRAGADVLKNPDARISPEPTVGMRPEGTGGGQRTTATQGVDAPSGPLVPLLQQIKALHRERQDFHSTEKGVVLRIKSIQRRIHAAESGCPKKLHATCPGVYDIACPTIDLLDAPLKMLEAERVRREKAMAKLAPELPAFAWWNAIRGLGALGLAQIVAEAGDLRLYANPAKLWSRFGVGAIGAERSPRRRAVLFCVGDSLLRSNRDTWKRLYDDRKDFERGKPACLKPFKAGGSCKDADGAACCKAGHIHNRATRFVQKRLLLELWKAWRGAAPVSEATA